MPNHRPSHLALYLSKLIRWLSLNRLRENNSLKWGGGELSAVLDELAETLDVQQIVLDDLILWENK